MKKTLLSLSGIAVLTALLAYPVFAHHPGWSSSGRHMGPGYHMGGGYHMDGDYSHGPRGWGGTTLTEDQRTKLDTLQETFTTETKEIRENLWEKTRALNELMADSETDTTAATSLQKEINTLQNTLSEKQLLFDLEAKNIVPETGLSNYFCAGPGYGNWR